jgi:predicted P-loop ATPase/GTPase
MKIEIEIPDSISGDAIKANADAIKKNIAKMRPGQPIVVEGTDLEIVQKYYSDQMVTVYLRQVQLKAIQDVKDKINGNNIPG